MKHLIAVIALTCVFFAPILKAESYWVEVAAYGERVSDDYFDAAGLDNVVLHLDHNLIYRYYIKELAGKNQAEAAKTKAVEKGFRYAKVVDMDLLRSLCNSPCVKGTNLEEKPIVEAVYFDFDRSALRRDARQKLDELSTVLQVVPNLEVKINGHTDAKGSDRYNDALSQKRAEQARQYLLAQHIPSPKVKMERYGETLPIAVNERYNGQDEPEGRQYNRRVELILTLEGQPIAYEEVKKILYASIPSHLRYR